MTIYLDCNATTPVDPRVQAEIVRCFNEEFGNAGSPHEFGLRAKALVHQARDRIAKLVAAKRHEIVFTSGATESNNLAILGLAVHGTAVGKRHIVSSQIEHKAVLEPLGVLRNRGFQVTLVPPESSGRVAAPAIVDAVRPDTLLVSLMHVNNETGVIQPIQEVAQRLQDHDAFLHVDAAQGFGKDLEPLKESRIDLISISSHKIYGPAGVGALVVRRTRPEPIPLTPLMHGGGQESGLRPGTLPVPLISGFGLAAELSLKEHSERADVARKIRRHVLGALRDVHPTIHGDEDVTLPHVVNLSIPGFDGEQVIELLEGIAAVSNGSACTSICATSSHVLAAMGVREPALDGAIRISWSHATDEKELTSELARAVNRLRQGGY